MTLRSKKNLEGLKRLSGVMDISDKEALALEEMVGCVDFNALALKRLEGKLVCGNGSGKVWSITPLRFRDKNVLIWHTSSVLMGSEGSPPLPGKIFPYPQTPMPNNPGDRRLPPRNGWPFPFDFKYSPEEPNNGWWFPPRQTDPPSPVVPDMEWSITLTASPNPVVFNVDNGPTSVELAIFGKEEGWVSTLEGFCYLLFEGPAWLSTPGLMETLWTDGSLSEKKAVCVISIDPNDTRLSWPSSSTLSVYLVSPRLFSEPVKLRNSNGEYVKTSVTVEVVGVGINPAGPFDAWTIRENPIEYVPFTLVRKGISYYEAVTPSYSGGPNYYRRDSFVSKLYYSGGVWRFYWKYLFPGIGWVEEGPNDTPFVLGGYNSDGEPIGEAVYNYCGQRRNYINKNPT
ncbi:MAG: hypothetical protein QXT73_01330 [Candidatus Methanomethylicaceae archaeon]